MGGPRLSLHVGVLAARGRGRSGHGDQSRDRDGVPCRVSATSADRARFVVRSRRGEWDTKAEDHGYTALHDASGDIITARQTAIVLGSPL